MGIKELLTQVSGWCNRCETGLELAVLVPAGLIWYTYLNISFPGGGGLVAGDHLLSYLEKRNLWKRELIQITM